VERGDLLVGVNGNPLSSVDELFDALEGGGVLKLDVLRGTEERTVDVPLQ
jgi:S1-C subfamily serine protease